MGLACIVHTEQNSLYNLRKYNFKIPKNLYSINFHNLLFRGILCLKLYYHFFFRNFEIYRSDSVDSQTFQLGAASGDIFYFFYALGVSFKPFLCAWRLFLTLPMRPGIIQLIPGKYCKFQETIQNHFSEQDPRDALFEKNVLFFQHSVPF